MALNKVLLQGRLVADPELKKVGDDVSVVSFRIAVDRDRKNKDGERESDFFNITAWRGTADFVTQYFAKGDAIVIDGRLQQRSWEDGEGNKRSAVDVSAENVYFGGPKAANASDNQDGLPF